MKSRRNMVLAISFAIGAMLAARCAVPPSITAINAEQLDDRTARITYKLVNGPAVVTMEALTNGQNGAWGTLSGTEMTSLAGDVNRLVSGGTDDTVREIRWQPGTAFSQSKISYESIRFSLKAWATNDPPPYMVVSLAKVAEPRTMYYASTNDMPGGLLSNRRYRTDAIVMRKIPAKGVTWWMGSTNETTWVENVNREVRHKVTLADNYYIGVFPVTQRQWANVMLTQVSDAATYHAWHSGGGYGDMRAMEWLSFYELREDSVKSYANGQWAGAKNTDYQYPNPPNPNSFLGKLRNRTGIDFDLPSEAQWEYACRAGHGTGYWGDGSVLNANNPANLARIACFKRASGTDAEDADPAVGGTPIVGSCAPNDFGVYDMNGCVWEYCLDWIAVDITSLSDGRPNANGEYLVTDPSTKGSNHIRRGGCYYSDFGTCRPSFRHNAAAAVSSREKGMGVRVACPAVVK